MLLACVFIKEKVATEVLVVPTCVLETSMYTIATGGQAGPGGIFVRRGGRGMGVCDTVMPTVSIAVVEY
jgi:hypothetical protein